VFAYLPVCAAGFGFGKLIGAPSYV
jgi:hypothetical protein